VEIEIRRPDDWHLHLRDGAAMAAVLPFTAERFARAIVMPESQAAGDHRSLPATDYRQRILARCPRDSAFSPLMTLYLTDQTDAAEIDKALKSQCVHACKLYRPAPLPTRTRASRT
jgi:dihydroorotase